MKISPYILIIFFLLHCASTLAQKQLKGVITNDSDVEGIHIINQSNKYSTITNETGMFSIWAKKGDTLLVSAVQWTPQRVIIKQSQVDVGKIEITLKNLLNELDEVTVRKTDLSGNIIVDAETIKTETVSTNGWGLTYEMLHFNQDLTPDDQSSFEGNVATDHYHNGQRQAELNLATGFKWLARKIFKNKNRNVEIPNATYSLILKLQQRFTRDQIVTLFNIKEDSAGDFCYFLVENGLSNDLFLLENELDLYQFITDKAQAYKQQQDEK